MMFYEVTGLNWAVIGVACIISLVLVAWCNRAK